MPRILVKFESGYSTLIPLHLADTKKKQLVRATVSGRSRNNGQVISGDGWSQSGCTRETPNGGGGGRKLC